MSWLDLEAGCSDDEDENGILFEENEIDDAENEEDRGFIDNSTYSFDLSQFRRFDQDYDEECSDFDEILLFYLAIVCSSRLCDLWRRCRRFGSDKQREM
jgi:hypothetical protein